MRASDLLHMVEAAPAKRLPGRRHKGHGVRRGEDAVVAVRVGAFGMKGRIEQHLGDDARHPALAGIFVAPDDARHRAGERRAGECPRKGARERGNGGHSGRGVSRHGTRRCDTRRAVRLNDRLRRGATGALRLALRRVRVALRAQQCSRRRSTSGAAQQGIDELELAQAAVTQQAPGTLARDASRGRQNLQGGIAHPCGKTAEQHRPTSRNAPLDRFPIIGRAGSCRDGRLGIERARTCRGRHLGIERARPCQRDATGPAWRAIRNQMCCRQENPFSREAGKGFSVARIVR